MTRFGRAAVWLAMLAPLGAAFAASCTIVHHPDSTTTTSTAGSGSSGAAGSGGGSASASSTSTSTSTSSSSGTGGAAPMISCRNVFEQTVQTQIMTECGACHQIGGVADNPFLAGPDIYASITAWPDVVVSPPDNCVLITHSDDPSHGGGQAPHMSATLEAEVVNWLGCELANLPVADGGTTPTLPVFKPFVSGAFNAVYLDPLGTAFQSSSITFNAEELGTPPTLLVLTNLEVHPISGITLHIVHPLFSIFPATGGVIPDPIDSFSGLDQTFTIASPPELGTGSVVLSQWSADAHLSISFSTITASTTTGGVNTCMDLTDFQGDVVPQIAQMWPCAMMCHGGGNLQAQQQMDLSMLLASTPDYAGACSQVRARITPGDPTTSQILIVTDPSQQAVHLFKFSGNTTNYNSFQAAVTPWIMGEQ